MWKYKKAILSGLAIGLLNVVYVLLNMGNDARAMWGISDIIFSDYTYHFFFSFFLFILIDADRHYELELHRFKILDDYRKFQFIQDMKLIFICFLVMTPIQVLMYGIFDGGHAVLVLLLRNGLIFCFISFFTYIYCQIPFKYKRISIICFYLFWNFEMTTMIILSDTWIGTYNIFIILKTINLIRILKYISCAAAIIFLIKLIQEGGSRRWLD